MEGCEENPSFDLPFGAIFEILTRVSLKTLPRCRLVCKEWNRFTHESNFTGLHCRRTGTISGYFIQSEHNCKYSTTFVSVDDSPSILRPSLDFLPVDVKIESSTNQGLLCCVSRGTRIPRYYICKPTTREWRAMPNPKMRYFTEKTTMIVRRSDPLHYCIVRFSRTKCGCASLRCEIFDSERWAWRRSSDIRLPQSVFLGRGPAVSANGILHWLTGDDDIFAFDVDRESWRIIHLPQEIVHANKELERKQLVRLVRCVGQLALFYLKDDWMELWVLEDYSKEGWMNRQRLSLEVLNNKKEGPSDVAALYTSDVALMKGFCKLIWYNCQNYTLTEVQIDKYIDSREIYAFQSDLEPIILNPLH